MSNVKFREVKWLVQGPTTSKHFLFNSGYPFMEGGLRGEDSNCFVFVRDAWGERWKEITR